MNKRTGDETGGDAGAPPQVEVNLPEPPKVRVSALAMAEYLERYADQLRHAAKQLREHAAEQAQAKQAGKHKKQMHVRWPLHAIIMECNGGANGGE